MASPSIARAARSGYMRIARDRRDAGDEAGYEEWQAAAMQAGERPSVAEVIAARRRRNGDSEDET